ncbi:MAG: hypothetical protein MPJ24_05935 [Pirellulaceae bacterium]|nr:hypothetical protein [Pirellulaceae bacterium]
MKINLAWILCFFLLLSFSGCGGCIFEGGLFGDSAETTDTDSEGKEKDTDGKEDKEKDNEKKDVRKKEPDYELASLRVLPFDETSKTIALKPGHWSGVRQEAIANIDDTNAELATTIEKKIGQGAFRLPSTNYTLRFRRTAKLPKKQAKYLESTYFVPYDYSEYLSKIEYSDDDREGYFDDPTIQSTDQSDFSVEDPTTQASFWIDTKLQSTAGYTLANRRERGKSMPDYQYFFVILAKDPTRYGFVKSLTTIVAPDKDATLIQGELQYYRVISPPIDKGVLPLSPHSLQWTSTAYLLWDEVEPEALSPAQQVAMLDWLHYGGQLIISGPNSLTKLRESFLAPYLPAYDGGAIPLTEEDFAPLGRYWSIGSNRAEGISLRDESSIAGVNLVLTERGKELQGTNNLVAEGRIGRGRIVVTGFPLTNRSLLSWPSYDSFFHNGLLRRPERTFGVEELGSLWSKWVDFPKLGRDARLSTTLRYFSRDMSHLPFVTRTTSSKRNGQNNGKKEGLTEEEERRKNSWDKVSRTPMWEEKGYALWGPTDPRYSLVYEERSEEEVVPSVMESDLYPKGKTSHFGGFRSWAGTGVGAWNDFSGTASESREILTELTGQRLPGIWFIFLILGAYVIILVPINWGFWRALDRLEWAWFSAPVIALLAIVVMARMMEIDVRLVRTQTEIGVLEIQPGYDRAHLTLYASLYNSVSNRYDFLVEDDKAQIQPFAAAGDFDLDKKGLSLRELTYVQADESKVGQFLVASNTAGLIHAEQMIPLEGSIRLLGDGEIGTKVKNESRINLHDVGVLRRDEEGTLWGSWVGGLSSKGTRSITLENLGQERAIKIDADDELFKNWQESLVMGGKAKEDRMGAANFRRLLKLSLEQLELGRGESRLIGWTDEPLSPVQADPGGAEIYSQTFVLAHLEYSSWKRPGPDKNLLADVKKEQERRNKIDAEQGQNRIDGRGGE